MSQDPEYIEGITIEHSYCTSDGNTWEDINSANLWQAWLNMSPNEKDFKVQKFEVLLHKHFEAYDKLLDKYESLKEKLNS